MFKKILTITLAVSCFIQPVSAFADRGGPGGRGDWHGGGPGGGGRGLAIAQLAVSSATLLYMAGLFYRSTPAGYVVVQPPPGIVVQALPPGYAVYYANGMQYYYYGNTYYAPAPGGYVVVQPPPTAVMTPAPAAAQATPVTTVQAAPVALQQTTAPAAASAVTSSTPQVQSEDAFEIYLSNGNGSYTSVTLRKTEKGFLGPQGEFYSDHPTEAQLRERYLKKN